MTPIYDRHKAHVGWLDGEYIFDVSLSWVAFHASGDVFSAASGEWLGPLDQAPCKTAKAR
jgi:hypothetical protein